MQWEQIGLLSLTLKISVSKYWFMEGNLHVLYEDNHLIIVNKPGGVLVQGDETGDTPIVETAKQYLKEKYQKPGDVFLGVVHRLDRPVSGVVIFARTSKSLGRMNKLFRERKVYKTYWAVVKKRPPQEKGKLTNWLVKNPEKNVVSSFDRPGEDRQKAELYFKELGRLNEHSLLEINPITGRPHQIRVQLASMGCPIRGDLKYGFHKPNKDGNINLHARRVVFEHPVKNEKMIVTAPLPDNDFWNQFLILDDQKIRDKDIDRIF